MEKYLIFKIMHSGLSNLVMVYETAIALSLLTNRRLVLCNPNYRGTLDPVDKGGFTFDRFRGKKLPHIKEQTIDEFLNPHGVDIMNYDTFNNNVLNSNRKFSTKRDLISLNQACFTQEPITEDTHNFANGRDIITDPGADLWYLLEYNLSHYSYFFKDKTPQLRDALSIIQYKPIYHYIADEIVKRLGHFNCIHYRMTDHIWQFYNQQTMTQFVHHNVTSVIPTDELLVVCTDEPPDHPEFNLIKSTYKNIIFLDDFIVDYCGDLINQLECINISAWGIVLQLVAKRANIFMGTLGSTFTALIHRFIALDKYREHGYIPEFLYLSDTALVESSPTFKNGRFIDVNRNRYSWNRHSMDVSPDALSWWKEYPECVFSNL